VDCALISIDGQNGEERTTAAVSTDAPTQDFDVIVLS